MSVNDIAWDEALADLHARHEERVRAWHALFDPLAALDLTPEQMTVVAEVIAAVRKADRDAFQAEFDKFAKRRGFVKR